MSHEDQNRASYEDQEHDRRLLRKLVIEMLGRYQWHQDGGQTTTNGYWSCAISWQAREELMDKLNLLKVRYE